MRRRMTDNRYLWRPDPKGEDIPQTLFGLPIVFNDAVPNDSVIVLGDFSHYVVVDVNGEKCLLSDVLDALTHEELHQLLAGKAVLIDDMEEGEMSENPYDTVNKEYNERSRQEGTREYWAEQCSAFQRELYRTRDRLGEVAKERDAARAALKKLEWVPHVTSAGVLWKCGVCHGWKNDGHRDNCELQAAL